MGTTLIPVMFADLNITICPHSATQAQCLGRALRLGDFLPGERVRVSRIQGTNEYRFEGQNRTFAEGPEL